MTMGYITHPIPKSSLYKSYKRHPFSRETIQYPFLVVRNLESHRSLLMGQMKYFLMKFNSVSWFIPQG